MRCNLELRFEPIEGDRLEEQRVSQGRVADVVAGRLGRIRGLFRAPRKP
jgi:hypothetical protein